MDEVAELIAMLLPETSVRRISYADVFLEHLQIDPHLVELSSLQSLAVDLKRPDSPFSSSSSSPKGFRLALENAVHFVVPKQKSGTKPLPKAAPMISGVLTS